ncbi:diguanylate cyclase PdgA [Shewanella xiamenensis]|uniref:diguanylate cyclase PdgA n=1 Tax=Shewanella xiamenensis TaxID=332186 RepID=UPI001666E7F1|nr:diguanylate cyclase PdgA [Shewanella xiamenensis]MCL1072517.1 diguanylate cyclase PdgA [Shewanella xiamenensis]GGN02065.1 GGDEF domain-containing protein [Shewanella xiamenensis]
MIRWQHLLNKLTTDDPLLQEKLSIWRAHPHKTPLALIQGFSFISANSATLDYFGTEYDTFVNATPYDFSPRIQSSGRNSVEFAREMILEAVSGVNVEFSWLHLNHQGNELPTRVNLYRCYLQQQPVVLVELQALNRRTQVRPAIADGFAHIPKEILSTTLEESAEAVYITDTDNKVLAVNKAMCRICGYSAEQLINKTPDFLEANPLNLSEQSECLQALKQRGFWQGEALKQRSDGSTFPAWQSSRRIAADGIQYHVNIFSDISTKKLLETQLTTRAMYDTLTGLPNRFHLKQILNGALDKLKDDPLVLGALMFLDLNGFKNINDSFGHSMGDRVLQLVAARLEAGCIEKADIARMGGDEFTLVLQDCSCKEEIQEFAEQILSLFDSPFEIEGQKFFLGTSIGIALFPTHGDQAGQLISLADTAMYCAKKNQPHLVFYDKAMSQAAELKLKLINNLRHAHSLKQFKLAYQAIVDLHTNTPIGAEALLRWQKSPSEHYEAAEFVPLLEETGLIVSIGQWVLEQACKQASLWRAQYQPDFKISVNVSPLQLEHVDFVGQVVSALEMVALPAEALILEITESALLRQPEQARYTLERIKALGVGIAIDDFGTGLSSLSRLGTLPIDSVKIDAEFVLRLNDVSGQKLCHAIVQLAQALNIHFVAEGIETQQQKDIITHMGQGFAQGFLFGYPSYVEQFTQSYLAEKYIA